MGDIPMSTLKVLYLL